MNESACESGSTFSQLTHGLNDHKDKSYCILPHKYSGGDTELRTRYQGTCASSSTHFENYNILKQCLIKYYEVFDPIHAQSTQLRANQADFVTKYWNKMQMPAIKGMEKWQSFWMTSVYNLNSNTP
jgi:hypothetical protein